ncbi:MAG: hypothetical protein DSZ31_01560 [Gammaproteobacteria bacterium]|nr:MAG: hypothetical protein DSZ31_01560 [Gammaproteobacteria bacterium]
MVLTDNDELNLAVALFIRENWKKKNVVMTLPPAKAGGFSPLYRSELSPPKTGGGACLSPLRGGLKPTPM